MKIETDGARGLPSNVLSCGAGKTEQAYITPSNILTLIARARNGDKSAEAELMAELEDDFRQIAAAVLTVSPKCDEITGENAHLSEKEEQFVEAMTLGWDLLQEALHGNSVAYFTGCHKGKQISFVGHMKTLYRWEVFEKYHADRRGVSRRSWRRFQKAVREAHEHGVFDDSAIPLARERVEAGQYKGVISLEMFDRCWNEVAPFSIQMEWATDSDDEPNSIEQTLTSSVFSFPESSLEGRAAQEAFDKMPGRWQEMFGRATGIFGKTENHADIGKDFGISGQRVGQIVNGAREHLKTAVDIARFDHGLPSLEM